MTLLTPPRVATWLLQHLGPRYQCDSLAGDLFEEYQQGRSRTWYWRQVIVAVGIGRAMHLAVLLPLLPQRAAMTRRMTLIKRLLGAFIVTALSAGALTWAGGASHTSQQCTSHPCTAGSSSSID